MHRRQFLRTFGLGSTLFALGGRRLMAARQTGTGKPRNVIFILTDDHRYDAFSFLGHPFLETPNMDRLALQGANLKNAFVTTSLCSPSRASVLTGQYAHKHQVVDNATRMPEHLRLFPEYLQDAGYKTAFIGKWHMGGSSDEPRRGFDHWVSFRGQGRYYPPEGNSDWHLNVDGRAMPQTKYITDELTDYAVDWLEQQDDDQPFFMYLSHKGTHDPFEPAERHKGAYAGQPFPEPATMANTEENYNDKPMWVKNQRNSWHGVDFSYHHMRDATLTELYQRYCEALLSIDESTGRLLDSLEQQGRLDDTLILYMGDNGFQWGEHGLIDKRTAYEASMRVPLLAHCPNLIQPGTAIGEQVANIDIGPTIMEAAGVSTPDQMDGASFLRLLSGEKIPWREDLLYEYFWEYSFPQTPAMHALRTNKYKYIRYYGVWDLNELYNLEEDPDETVNLFTHPDHQEVVRDMRNRLAAILEETAGLEIPFRVLPHANNLRLKSGAKPAGFPEEFMRQKNAQY